MKLKNYRIVGLRRYKSRNSFSTDTIAENDYKEQGSSGTNKCDKCDKRFPSSDKWYKTWKRLYIVGRTNCFYIVCSKECATALVFEYLNKEN